MQRGKKNPVIKNTSTIWRCSKCKNQLVYWRTKAGKLVYECEKCGWAEVEDE